MSVSSVIEYPEEGFAILEDENGKFLAFKDREEIEEVPSKIEVNPISLLSRPGIIPFLFGPASF
jgi:hypothetical protein